MSNELTKKAFEEAYQTILEKVYAPTYFTKLARQYRIVPRNDQERLQLLELAGLLRRASDREAEVQKTASANNSLINEAVDSLKRVMSSEYPELAEATSDKQRAKVAADLFAADPDIQNAAMLYSLAVAENAISE